MAMTTGRSSGGGSYSYTVTETYTLEEAINKASSGSLSPGEVYRQMPGAIQGEVNKIALRRNSKDFTSLDLTEQRQVMAALAAEIKREKEEAKKPVSLFDALKLASEGKIDDLRLYDALPQDLQVALDGLAEKLGSPDFKRAKSEIRTRVIKVVAGALAEQSARNAAAEGLDVHNRALDLKKKGNSAEALKLMKDAEKALNGFISTNSAPSAATVSAYCNLSSARAHIGDWTSNASVLLSAITAADHGLERLGKPAAQPVFERGALFHNRAHARFRLGEIKHDFALLIQGRKGIAEAKEVFQALKQAQALKENSELASRIENAIARLQPANNVNSSRLTSPSPSGNQQVSKLQTSGEVSKHHPSADGTRAARLNIKFQKALKEWEALPWLKRWRTPKPAPPRGI